MKKNIILVLVFISCFIFSAQHSGFNVKLEKGETFPVLVLRSLDGSENLSTDVFDKNKETLIVIAAEWCPDCQMEMPYLDQFYKKNKNKYNTAVIFINARSSEEAVKSYIKENKYKFPVYYDYTGEILKGLNINSVPTNIIINKNGKIRLAESGTWEEKEFINNFK